MIYLVQRIIVNTHGWTKPSPGRLGPIGEGEYVRENGFGHEDWNFNLDLSIDNFIYGYAYYAPSGPKRDDMFNIAFVTYAGGQWRLAGFYSNACFIPSGSPKDHAVCTQKADHLLGLASNRSLGKNWSVLDRRRMVRQLKDDMQWLRWRVRTRDVATLSAPIVIPARTFTSSNYRLTTPTEVTLAAFKELQSLASREVLVVDEVDENFPEGREMLLQHRARERNRSLTAAAKRAAVRRHGRLRCQVCGFDFEAFYGEVGSNFIEAHHTIPVSSLRPNATTRVRDIALVCANCHRMLHRRRPWLTMSTLVGLMKTSLPESSLTST